MFKPISLIRRWLRAQLAPSVDRPEDAGDRVRIEPAQNSDAASEPTASDAATQPLSPLREESNADPFPEPVRLEVEDVFDLHTVQPREVKIAVEEYLREAHAKRLRTVRIIHGKGRGALRAQVRSILARTPFVIGWTDAPPEAGGWGATLVQLKTIDEEPKRAMSVKTRDLSEIESQRAS
jgi:DNA-nicking Smr family endonuclease